ncbi:hypothetical protein BH09BAC3_BH09BAC3_13940 [soil metagenome]
MLILFIFVVMKTPFPEAKRPLEYVALFHFQVSTMEGPGFVFVAVDAFTQFAFSLGVERDESRSAVLKNIYFLMEQPDFVKYIDGEFTLVLGEHEELSDEIRAILKPVKGKLLFNKGFNSYLASPVLKSVRESMFKDMQKK